MEENEAVDESMETIETLLNSDDAVDVANAQVFKACIASGKVPLNAVSLELLLRIHTDESDDSEEYSISDIVLTNADKEVSIQSLASVWISSLKEMINIRKVVSLDDEDLTDDQKELYLTTESQYNSDFAAFKEALKYLLSVELVESKKNNKLLRIDETYAGVTPVLGCLSEIYAMRDDKDAFDFAYGELFRLPRAYVEVVTRIYTRKTD